MYNVAMNILCESMFLIVLGMYLGVQLLGPMVTVFFELPKCFSTWPHHFTFLPAVCEGFSILVNTSFVYLLDHSHLRCVKWCLIVILITFLSKLMMLSIFHVLFGYLCIFFGELSIQICCYFLMGLFIFL